MKPKKLVELVEIGSVTPRVEILAEEGFLMRSGRDLGEGGENMGGTGSLYPDGDVGRGGNTGGEGGI
jgi:hypothetical protein